MAFQITKYKRKTVPVNVEPVYVVSKEVAPAPEKVAEKNNAKKTEKSNGRKNQQG